MSIMQLEEICVKGCSAPLLAYFPYFISGDILTM
jgi:hypothetical protein